MMLCLHCGKEISDGAKFCPYCGGITAAAAPGPEPAPSQGGTQETPGYSYGKPQGGQEAWDAAPPDGKKGGKKGLIIGGAAAAVAVAALLAVFLSGLFSSPKGKVEKAVAKTCAAYADAGRRMELPDMAELTRKGSVSQRLRMELNSVNSDLTGYDLSALNGLGVSVSSDCDREGRRMGGELAAFWGENELLCFQVGVDDNVLSIASPQLTQQSAYGVDTETLGADLARLGVEDENIDVSSIGFNLFELMEQSASTGQTNEELERTMKEAAIRLAEAVQVEKAGKKEVDVNGKRVNAGAYLVTIPQQALEDYMDAVEEAMELVDSQESVKRMLRAIGLDEDTIEGIMPYAGGTSYDEVFDALEQMLEAAGDVELDVYLDGGYVCAVEYSKQQNGSTLEIGLYLGGGDSYVDKLSFRVTVDTEELLVESSGNHGGRDGVFTDKTTLRLRFGGSTAMRIISDFRYEPKALSGNFGWNLNVNNTVSAEMSGQLSVEKDSFDLQLDDVTVWAAGVKLCSLAVDCSAGPCRSIAVSLPAPELLGEMDEGDLMDLYYDVEYNSQQWIYHMMELIPEDLLYALW